MQLVFGISPPESIKDAWDVTIQPILIPGNIVVALEYREKLRMQITALCARKARDESETLHLKLQAAPT